EVRNRRKIFFPLTSASLRSGRPRGLLLKGSHGSGRADFPHPALRSKDSLREHTHCERLEPAAEGSCRARTGSAARSCAHVVIAGLTRCATRAPSTGGSTSTPGHCPSHRSTHSGLAAYD